MASPLRGIPSQAMHLGALRHLCFWSALDPVESNRFIQTDGLWPETVGALYNSTLNGAE